MSLTEGHEIQLVPGWERFVRRVLVLDRDALALADTSGVDVQPAYEWLLAGPDAGGR